MIVFTSLRNFLSLFALILNADIRQKTADFGQYVFDMPLFECTRTSIRIFFLEIIIITLLSRHKVCKEAKTIIVVDVWLS